MARPRFVATSPEDAIRHPYGCGHEPGPNIPQHWFDGGNGWVTRYFYDYAVRNAQVQEPGKYRCQVRLPNGELCDHEVSEHECCKGNFCWQSGTVAHLRMNQHLQLDHGIPPPPLRQWSTDLFDMTGCVDAMFCAPCIGARMMMALLGWNDTFHWGWCVYFTFMGLRSAGHGQHQVVYWVPPHVYVAIVTRSCMVTLNNIDEGCCTTLWTALCCPLCSMMQTYRELTASGMYPGGYCSKNNKGRQEFGPVTRDVKMV